MGREIAISLYLFFFSILFYFFKMFPQKKKTAFVVTFIENSSNIYDEMRRQDPSCRTVFLTSKKVYSFYAKYDDATVLQFEPSKILSFIKSIYHLATAKVIIVDNYYGFLSAVRFRKNVTCLQIWHATGAIKRFGLKDPSNDKRSSKAIKRFKKVYGKFNKVIVGSDKMAYIFKQAFDLKEEQILRTGIPKTDVFFNKKYVQLIQKNMCDKFPFLKKKKIILYAPTYRDDELDRFRLHLDLDRMKKELEDEYIVLLRIHPAVNQSINIEQYEGFVYNFSDYTKLTDILFITDILISDYSSIPFDFSILEKPMIFYPYDLETYEKTRGFWGDYRSIVPGPIARTTDEIIQFIKTEQFQTDKLKSFKNDWNKYSKGKSSEKVAEWIIETLNGQF